MSEARSLQWRRRIDRLHDRVKSLRSQRRYDRAERAGLVLRRAYDSWAREIDFDHAA